MRTLILGAILLLAVSASAHAALPAGISGPWYNPAQSGHGLSVEILDDGRALAFWYVFDPDGKPVHLYIEGDVIGNSIQGEAYLGRGMRFGSFDPDEHVLSRWGSVQLAFSSCDSGSLQWQPDGPAGSGYTAGTMPLTRLAALAGLDCRLDDAGMLSAGSYTGALSDGIEPDLHGAVDRDGVLWVMQGALTPSGPYVGPDFHVVRGLPLDQLAVDATFHQNFALAGGRSGIGDQVALQFARDADGLLAAVASTDAYWTGRVDFELRQVPPGNDPPQRLVLVAVAAEGLFPDLALGLVAERD